MPTGVKRPSEIEAWEEEADVVVVGLGVAGACAALAAAAAGADTLVLERAGGGGGTSAMSGGVIYLGGGTALQKSCGFEDEPEQMFRYLMASCGADPDEAKIRLYCDGSVEHFDWLVAQGVPFKHTFYPHCSGEPPSDDGLVYSGSERFHPFCEIARPAPRGHVPAKPGVGGPLLMQVLCKQVEEATRVSPNTRVTDLVQEADGEVVGIVAERFGSPVRVRARGGVVLTTGGFILNDEMLRAHQPDSMKCMFRVAADGDDGSGIRLGMAAGAEAIHMDAASISLPATQPFGLKRGVMVNRHGQRFINEDIYYGRLGEWALFHNEGRAWLIVDDEIYEKPEYPPRKLVAVADTVAELGAELGLPEGALESTIGLYNRHAEKGHDAVFHKLPEYLKPLTKAPFGALDCTTESSLYAAFTLGGLRSDTEGRVLDPAGAAIPRLFAAGRATSGLSVGSYSSGLSLGDGSFFGRRAGRAAAG